VEAGVSAATRWICGRHARHYNSTPWSDGMGIVLPRWTMTKEPQGASVAAAKPQMFSQRVEHRAFHHCCQSNL
jgi:hypothetical protein